MCNSIKCLTTQLLFISLALFITGSIPGTAGTLPGVKTSQHPTFKPEHFERLAVIVKPIQQSQSSRMGMGFGMAANRGHQQAQLERLVEQGFMRALIAHGYTLVSRMDLDAAMVEKGLDQAKLTDEKYSEEAGKLLHVSALMIVSVDALNVTPIQRQGNRFVQQHPYYQIVASVGARLVKINDNMVMWTSDVTVDRTMTSQDEDSVVLGVMAESLGSALPAYPTKKDLVRSEKP